MRAMRQSDPGVGRTTRRDAVVYALSLALVVAVQQVSLGLAPALAVPSPVLAFALTFAAVTAAVLLASAFAPLLTRRFAWILLAPLGGMAGVAAFAPGATSAGAGAVVLVCLLGGGTLLGRAIGGRVEHPGHLLLVAYVTAIADLYSVFAPSGVTAHVAASETLLPLFAIPWPMLGLGELVPVLGVGDVVITAVYIAAAARHVLGMRRMLAALVAGYAATFVALVVTARGLPALPFLGLAVVLAVPRVWRLRREDRRAAVLGAVAITALFGTLTFVSL